VTLCAQTGIFEFYLTLDPKSITYDGTLRGIPSCTKFGDPACNCFLLIA